MTHDEQGDVAHSVRPTGLNDIDAEPAGEPVNNSQLVHSSTQD